MPAHLSPALPPPWDHYLAAIAAATATFWEDRQYPGYACLQGQRTWEELIENSEKILPLVHNVPLSVLERFLLFASAYLYEVGWQVNGALTLTLAQRYRESGQEIRRRAGRSDGRNDFGLSMLGKSSPLTVEALARLCEMVGDLVDGKDLSPHSQPQKAGNRETARLALLAALLRLADLLLNSRGRDWYLRTVSSFGSHNLADARLALGPYVAYFNLTNHTLTVHYCIHPHDKPLENQMRELFEEPLKQWWSKNWSWLVCTCHIQLLFQQVPSEDLPPETPLESLEKTCHALRQFLQTYHSPEIALPSLIEMETLKNTEECRKLRERYLILTGGQQTTEKYVESIQYYTCFISYSHQDQAFAEQLHTDLQTKGVRCWFAPHDMKTGDEIRTRIDESIHAHDKLLLILSEHSIFSSWVKKEVETAFEKESKENKMVLFPIRLDNAVMQATQTWAADIRKMRHITDFTGWKHHDDYQKAFNKLLSDLKAASK